LFTADEIADGIHGGDIETSIVLAVRPDMVRSGRAGRFESAVRSAGFKRLGVDKPASLAWMARDVNRSGTVGDASRATAEKGRAALAHGARAFVELLGEVERYSLPGKAEA
jgi:creatinine amidohydrolase